MKGKILIVLFSLVLVFGMLVASCDNGDYPKDPTKDAKENVTDANRHILDKGKIGDMVGAYTNPPEGTVYVSFDGNNFPDVDDDGNVITMSYKDAEALVDSEETSYDPETGVETTYTYIFAIVPSGKYMGETIIKKIPKP
jgi:hypothetical protein